MSRPSVAGIGAIMQLAFVPADFDAALAHWIAMGAGPFFALDHVKLEDVTYLGQPAEIDFSMVIGYWGDLQIELIRQHNDAPSIYRAWRDAGQEGLHHVCVLTDDIDAARAAVAAAGGRVLQAGGVPGGGAVFYADTGGGPGSMLEVLQPAPGGREFFAMMRDAHRDWDGADPVRRLG